MFIWFVKFVERFQVPSFAGARLAVEAGCGGRSRFQVQVYTMCYFKACRPWQEAYSRSKI
jgi:hypothetical protein